MASFHSHTLCSPSTTNPFNRFPPSPLSGSPHFRPLTSRLNLRIHAKFDKFEGPQANLEELPTSQQPLQIAEEDQEEDSDLPSDLVDAILQSSRASAMFLSSGGMRAIVELLIPQLQFLDDEGAQGELWELSRIFLESLREESGFQKVRAIFPDAGAAALLKYQWKDATFGFSSLSDRKPVQSEDEIVVMVVPDYQMLEYVEKVASQLSDDPPRPLIMWNPRLISEDVGVGINVRRLRRYFLSTFTIAYSMRPLPLGAVYRCYPGLWKVFYDDKDRPNRYLLAKEQVSRPDAEDLEPANLLQHLVLLLYERSQNSKQFHADPVAIANRIDNIRRCRREIREWTLLVG